MANLFTDADSKSATKTQVESLFCEDAMALYTADDKPMLMTTILHEAAHNLGPAQNYTVDGKTDEDALGGPLSSVYEELKAQTASLYLTDWLVERGVIERDFADKAHFADIAWAMGKIANGFVTADGGTLAYGQLAGIQVGYLLDNGAVTWNAGRMAANGTDTGCFSLDQEALPGAIDALGHEVFSIKATLDADRAAALRDRHVNASGDRADLWDTISERWLRVETATFVYSVDY
jgi:hypothetical protein